MREFTSYASPAFSRRRPNAGDGVNDLQISGAISSCATRLICLDGWQPVSSALASLFGALCGNKIVRKCEVVSDRPSSTGSAMEAPAKLLVGQPAKHTHTHQFDRFTFVSPVAVAPRATACVGHFRARARARLFAVLSASACRLCISSLTSCSSLAGAGAAKAIDRWCNYVHGARPSSPVAAARSARRHRRR